MIAAAVRRGLLAGLLAGVLAGLVGLLAGEPAVEEAIRLEEAAVPAGDVGPQGEVAEVTRPQQRAGLVLGTALLGVGAGALFGVASAWADGRVAGDAWQRSLKLGASALGAVVLLPALKYPPNPPAVGDPATVGTRTTLYLGLVLLGLLLAATACAAARRLAATTLVPPLRQALLGGGVVVVVAVVLAVLPDAASSGAIPADLLWRFRLSSVAVQATLLGVTAVAYGLLATRTRRGAPVGSR